MAHTPLLDLIDIRKSFGAIEALRGVSFAVAVAAGEVVALLGDNGAGKSTLARRGPLKRPSPSPWSGDQGAG